MRSAIKQEMRSEARAEFQLLRVERHYGNRLWVSSGRLAGWINADQVVTGQAAIDHFSTAITNDSQDWYAFMARGAAWQTFRSDLVKAIADYTAAIGLQTCATRSAITIARYAFYLNRDHDKSIADYNHAIRLVPSQAAYFNIVVSSGLQRTTTKTRPPISAMRSGYTPAMPEPYNSLAWLLATCPSAKDAQRQESRPGRRQGV